MSKAELGEVALGKRKEADLDPEEKAVSCSIQQA
jgi:hypothetical protein